VPAPELDFRQIQRLQVAKQDGTCTVDRHMDGVGGQPGDRGFLDQQGELFRGVEVSRMVLEKCRALLLPVPVVMLNAVRNVSARKSS